MIEAVPNVSEGRDRETIDALARAIESVDEVLLLDVAPDRDHHRTVFTYASESDEALLQATLALYAVALERIDLRRHEGQHPRVGAVDVCPFVPLQGAEMLHAMALAERVAAEVADRFQLPVYLYEYAARADYRRSLPSIRSGGFEQFPSRITDPRWKPDYGPADVHPSAGITIVGARMPLIAFNVQLSTDRIEIAEKLARAVRGISGGLRYVRALPIALAERGLVQVSMNLLDYRRTPLHRVFQLLESEASRYGVSIVSSEIIGLIPADALYAFAEWHLRIEKFRPSLVLERRLGEARENAAKTKR